MYNPNNFILSPTFVIIVIFSSRTLSSPRINFIEPVPPVITVIILFQFTIRCYKSVHFVTFIAIAIDIKPIKKTIPQFHNADCELPKTIASLNPLFK